MGNDITSRSLTRLNYIIVPKNQRSFFADIAIRGVITYFRRILNAIGSLLLYRHDMQ